MKLPYFRGFGRAALKSLKGRRLPMAALTYSPKFINVTIVEILL
jgi:hypothetical protein